jgi:para-nitrobenzyl esterase
MNKIVVPIAVLFLVACLRPLESQRAAGCVETSPDIACTEQDAIRGVVEGEMLGFKGIPYAQPPVGALRWRPPEPGERWEGVRDGSRYGSMCPQIVAKEVRGEEDCLFINVWRPREKPAQPLPVMVWLHGSGNHSASGEGVSTFGGLTYSGEKLVPHGVVFVSYNLRLNVLGFLAHPALDTERPEKISGNYGSLDQIAMLRWVKRNVAAFGGDPDKIFLFGTSAGGGNICALMTSPQTRGLIHGVSRQMVDYWTRMARTGNPNGGGDPEWPAVTATTDNYLEISATTLAKKGPASGNCDFWDTIPFVWPHV